MDWLSLEYVGDYANSIVAGPPRISLLLYQHPQQLEQILGDLQEELSTYGATVCRLELDECDLAGTLERWLGTLGAADEQTRLFVAKQLSSLRDDVFQSLCEGFETKRELILDQNRATLMLPITPDRINEISRFAPGFYSICDVVGLSTAKFRLPKDPAYEEDRKLLTTQLSNMEDKYGFPSQELWQRMSSGQCDDIPFSDLRLWERLVETLRED